MKKGLKVKVVANVNPQCPVDHISEVVDVDTATSIAWITGQDGEPHWFEFDELEEVK